jgi:hypothetical protein
VLLPRPTGAQLGLADRRELALQGRRQRVALIPQDGLGPDIVNELVGQALTAAAGLRILDPGDEPVDDRGTSLILGQQFRYYR